jgi:hypothetical protein
MAEITKVAPVLTVVEDNGEYVIRAQREIGEGMAKTILSQLKEASRVTYITDTDMKVFKADGLAKIAAPVAKVAEPAPQEPTRAPLASQRIVQDSSAPPVPELVDESYEAILRQQEQDARELSRQSQFNSQVPQDIIPEEEPVQETPRKRTRNIAPVAGSTCGRCGGGGTVVADTGDSGSCPVCQGKGQIHTWGRGKR